VSLALTQGQSDGEDKTGWKRNLLFGQVEIISHLLSRSAAMAIGAAHFALINFLSDRAPSHLATNHFRNGCGFSFLINMIELQHDWIRFAAVYTWVQTKILEQPFMCLLLVNFLSPHGLLNIVAYIIRVVIADIKLHALATSRVTLTFRLISPIELILCFLLIAGSPYPHNVSIN
jgi:hypothetical protein